MSIGTDKVSDSVLKFTKNADFLLSLVLYPGTRVFMELLRRHENCYHFFVLGHCLMSIMFGRLEASFLIRSISVYF
jgi:hypothetical protein